MNQGDVIYIYMTSPDKYMKYKCVAIIDDTIFCLDTTPYENYGRYMELKLLEEHDDGLLCIDALKKNGVKLLRGAMQST